MKTAKQSQYGRERPVGQGLQACPATGLQPNESPKRRNQDSPKPKIRNKAKVYLTYVITTQYEAI